MDNSQPTLSTLMATINQSEQYHAITHGDIAFRASMLEHALNVDLCEGIQRMSQIPMQNNTDDWLSFMKDIEDLVNKLHAGWYEFLL